MSVITTDQKAVLHARLRSLDREIEYLMMLIRSYQRTTRVTSVRGMPPIFTQLAEQIKQLDAERKQTRLGLKTKRGSCART